MKSMKHLQVRLHSIDIRQMDLQYDKEQAKIVYVSGPWPAGYYSDLNLFRLRLRIQLGLDEFLIADSGYPDSRCLQKTGRQHPKHKIFQKLGARHEVVNKRLKKFGAISSKFKHSSNH